MVLNLDQSKLAQLSSACCGQGFDLVFGGVLDHFLARSITNCRGMVELVEHGEVNFRFWDGCDFSS